MDYPDISLFELIKNTAQRIPDVKAYSYFGTNKTYSSFINDINDCARALRAIGISVGDTVTICMPNTPEAITVFYAVNQVGAIANMLHPLSSENEIISYINSSASKAVFILDIAMVKVEEKLIAHPELKSIVLSVSHSMPIHLAAGYFIKTIKTRPKLNYADNMMRWSEFLKTGENFTDETNAHLKGTAPAVILYSGGTTGMPKGILLSNHNFNAVAILSVEACVTVKEGDSFFSVMPIFHGFGLGICFHTAFYVGGNAIILPSFTAADFGKLLKKYQPNVLVGVPTLYEALISSVKDESLDLSFVRFAVSGGDTLPPKLKQQVDAFLEKHNCETRLREGYGLTECTTACCLMPHGEYKEGSIGKPFAKIEFKIVKPGTEQELAANEEGEIVVKSPTTMLGYLNDEEETSKQLREHKDGQQWLHTGDLGCIDEEGYVYFRQRLKRLIVSSGYNVYPQNIEKVIESHPAVFYCAVIGIDHPYKKQVAKAFIVLNKDVSETRDKIKRGIMEICKKNLPKYSIPAELEIRSELPKTLVGKIAYQKLADQES